MNTNKLWLVGQYLSGDFPEIVWGFQGVFDSEEKAVAACRDENYFVVPVALNLELPEKTVEFECECRYPMTGIGV